MNNQYLCSWLCDGVCCCSLVRGWLLKYPTWYQRVSYDTKTLLSDSSDVSDADRNNFFNDWSVYTWWWLLMKYVCMPCYCFAPNWGAVIVCLRGEHVSRTTHPVFTKFLCMLLYRWPWLVWRGILILHVLCFCGWQRGIGCLWLPCFTSVFIFLEYACT